MEIFVQNIASGLFYCGNGKWSADPAQAYAFPNGVAAMNFCQVQRSKQNLMMHFQSPMGLGLKISKAMQNDGPGLHLWRGPEAKPPSVLPQLTREK